MARLVSGDEVIGNVADYYIGVWNANNSKLDRNVAAGPAGYMYLATDENVTVAIQRCVVRRACCKPENGAAWLRACADACAHRTSEK